VSGLLELRDLSHGPVPVNDRHPHGDGHAAKSISGAPRSLAAIDGGCLRGGSVRALAGITVVIFVVA
jgi:hypothetical protein